MNSDFVSLSDGNQFADFTWDDLNPIYQNMNSATLWCGDKHWQNTTKSVNAVRLWFLFVGTVAYGELQLDIYNVNTNGTPDVAGGSLGSTTVTATGSLVSGNFNTFTFASPVSLTGGKFYAFVFRNLNATPTSNYPRYTRWSANQLWGDGLSRMGRGYVTTTNSGTSWTLATNTANIRIGYTDGTYEGMLVRYGAGLNSGAIYEGSGTGYGVTFTTKYAINLHTVQLALDKVGTVSGGDIGCRIYDKDSNLIATSLNLISATTISTTGCEYPFIFTPIKLNKDEKYWFIPYFETSKVGTGTIQNQTAEAEDSAESIALCRNLSLGSNPCSFNGTTLADVTTGVFYRQISLIRIWGNLDEPIPTPTGSSPDGWVNV
jgi:hypothetical protein